MFDPLSQTAQRRIPTMSAEQALRKFVSESVLTQRIGFLNFQHETAIWIRNEERAMSLAKGAIAGARIIFLGWNGRGKAKGDPPAMTTALQRL